ncbi:MAG: substrate-binding domain-containing protein [Lachnospiraceae bacterium]
MKRRIVTAIVMATMTLSLLAGCAGSSGSSESSTTSEATQEESTAAAESTSDEGPVIGYICKDLSQQWFIQVTDVLTEKAKELGAKDVILADTSMNPEKYLTALDNMIAQGVDVIIVCPPDQQLSQATVERCNEAGVKVFADADGLIDTDGNHIAPALELDAYKCGYSQGEWLGNYVKDNGLEEDPDTTYLVLTMDTVSSCVPRAEGAMDAFKETASKFDQSKIIRGDYDGTSEKAFDVVAATITANPAVKNWVVTAANEEGAQGAARALEQAGIDQNATVVGLGGYLAKDDFKKEYSCFKAAGYFMASEDGEAIATAAVEWAKDDSKIPFEEYKKDGEEYGVYPLGAVMVTAENYQEIMGDDAN